MVRCTFCNKEMEKGTGKKLIQNDGKTVYLCTSKCDRNMIKLGRKARNLKWTKPKKQKK